MLSAKLSDILRFVKSGYDRVEVQITASNYSSSLDIKLLKSPFLIPEVELSFQPTGNLTKDSKVLDQPKRVVALNSMLDNYMKSPPIVAEPKLSTPAAFAPHDLNAGHVNLLGAASALVKLFRKATEKPLTTPNYVETQDFYRRVKSSLDLSFYRKYGMDDEAIDRFLIYADENYSLAKKYRNNFNPVTISFEMKLAFSEYSKTHKIKS